MGLKVVGRWTPNGGVSEPGLKPDQVPTAINIFLIGNLLSILFSLFGAFIVGINCN